MIEVIFKIKKEYNCSSFLRCRRERERQKPLISIFYSAKYKNLERFVIMRNDL